MPKRDLGAPPPGLAGRRDLNAEIAAGFIDEPDKEIAECHGFLTRLLLIDTQPEVDRDLERQQAEHRWRPGQLAGDAVCRPVVRLEGEGRRMSHPARDRVTQLLLQAGRDKDICGCPRPAVQVLVTTADRQVDLGAVEIDRHRAGAVREVPQHQRSVPVSRRREVPHVVNRAAGVIDMGEHDDGDAAVDRGLELRPVDRSHGMVAGEQLDQPLGDIEIRRKVRGFAQDEMALGLQLQRSREQLEQVDRRAVGDDHLARFGADQPGDLVPDSARRLDPMGRVPAPDEAAAPFLGDHLVDARDGRTRQGPQRVAVEVHDAVGKGELVAEWSERILPVEREAGLAVHPAIIPLVPAQKWLGHQGTRSAANIASARATAPWRSSVMRPARCKVQNRLPLR